MSIGKTRVRTYNQAKSRQVHRNSILIGQILLLLLTRLHMDHIKNPLIREVSLVIPAESVQLSSQ